MSITGQQVRHRFPLALLAALAVTIFLAPILRQEVFVVRDHHDYFQPLRLFTAQELKAGRLPLWNPWNASGEPWLANPQTGVFYPPFWLFVVMPFPAAYMLYLLLHFVLLGWGAYLLFVRSVAPGAAMAGAAALMFSGPLLSLLDISNNFATFAWIPLALWCATAGAWRRGGVVLAMAFLAGEPFFAALGALLYVLVRRRRDVIGTAALAFGLSAVQLLPFLDFVRDSDRAAGMDGAAVLHDSMPWGDWLRIAIPSSAPSLVDPQLGQHFIPIVYMGIAVVALAVIGLASARRRDVQGWILLLLVSAVIASGPEVIGRLPLTLFRYPARLLPFAVLAVAGLAAVGWDRLRWNRRWLDLLLVLVIVADLLPRSRHLLETAPFNRHPVPYDASLGAKNKILRIGEVDSWRRDRWLFGYLNLYDRRFDAFTPAPLVTERYFRYYRKLVNTPTQQSLSAAGVGVVVTQRALAPPFRLVARRNDVLVYEFPLVMPMASLVWPDPVGMQPAHYELDTSRAGVTIDAARDGILVLRQQAARGWKVQIDGKPAESLLIDGVFRGVRLSKGRHEVVWTYRPPSLFIGSAMTLVTLATMFSLSFVKRSRT